MQTFNVQVGMLYLLFVLRITFSYHILNVNHWQVCCEIIAVILCKWMAVLVLLLWGSLGKGCSCTECQTARGISDWQRKITLKISGSYYRSLIHKSSTFSEVITAGCAWHFETLSPAQKGLF